MMRARPAGVGGQPPGSTRNGAPMRGRWLPTTERVVIALALLLLLLLHGLVLENAGGLWRDEIQTLWTATRPTLGLLWDALAIESFPALCHLVFRVWCAAFGDGDGVRVLGMMIGWCGVGALWFNASRLGHTLPFASVLLFALNPVTILWGDSIRAYGLSAVFIVLTFTSIWQVAEGPSRNRVVLALGACLGCAHSLFQGAVFVFAACMGGCAVCLKYRRWQRAGIILGLGALTAATLPVYLDTLRRKDEWKVLHEVEFNFERVWSTLQEALGAPHAFMLWIWLGAGALALGATGWTSWRRTAAPAEKDLALYSLTTVLIALVGFSLFLWILGFPTQTWYYVPLMALVAAFLDVAFAPHGTDTLRRSVRMGAFVLLACFNLPATWMAVHERFTNLDLIARNLHRDAQVGDLIVVTPWYTGATFHRYYRGAAAWTTNPAFEDTSNQRGDLLKAKMESPNPTGPVLEQMAQALRRGHRVWWVGGLARLRPGAVMPDIRPAPDPRYGWKNTVYLRFWALQTGQFIQQHAESVELLAAPTPAKINWFENQKVLLVQGWRP